jgi:hypothetical protein
MLYFGPGRGAFACMVRDLTKAGARIQIGDLKPPEAFQISFDGFESTVDCVLAWRKSPFAGIAFRQPVILTP